MESQNAKLNRGGINRCQNKIEYIDNSNDGFRIVKMLNS